MIRLSKHSKEIIVQDDERKELHELKKSLPKTVQSKLDRIANLEQKIKDKSKKFMSQ
jgi:hypothetical protein